VGPKSLAGSAAIVTRRGHPRHGKMSLLVEAWFWLITVVEPKVIVPRL
jgi:hypothetical protein